MIALLLMAVGVTVLRDEVDTIPAGQFRYQEFPVGPTLPADLHCEFRVSDGVEVKVELMTRDDLQLLLKGREYEAIAVSTSGTLHQEIGISGQFALVLRDLDHSRPAQVSTRVTLDTTGQSLVKARSLSPARKLTVILSSFTGFLLIVTFSARKLLLAMKSKP